MLILLTILPYLFIIAENEIEQRILDPHNWMSNIFLSQMLLFFFLVGVLQDVPTYLAEYIGLRTIIFAPYWSLRKYGHIYYLGGGTINKIERFLGDDIRMYARLWLIILYVVYILHRFAVI